MRTKFTELLGIEHPIVSAGMGGIAHAPLAAAVSAAGGIGQLGASVYSNAELAEACASVRKVTDRPFAVNLLAPVAGGEMKRLFSKTEEDDNAKTFMEQIDIAVDGGATMIVSGLGVPAGVVEHCHRRGVVVASMCGKVVHAERAAAVGCDIVIAQGTEAGGHTGSVAGMALVPLVVDAVAGRSLVLAAGAIFDGRGIVAAASLGAEGAVLGTRFAATPEARGVTGYKEAMVDAREDSTVITRSYTGKTLRALRNDWTDYYDQHPEEVLKFPAMFELSREAGVNNLSYDGDIEGVDVRREMYPAGQGVGGIRAIEPAGEVVARIAKEADAALARLAGLVSV